MKDYRLELRIKNAALYHAIMSRHRGVAEFCRMFGHRETDLNGWMCLRSIPFSYRGGGKNRTWMPGVYKESALKVAADLGENPEDIFPIGCCPNFLPGRSG